MMLTSKADGFDIDCGSNASVGPECDAEGEYLMLMSAADVFDTKRART